MIAAAVLASLTPECRDLVQRVIDACAAQGLTMRAYGGTRDPVAQAALWRQSRSWATIAAELKSLRQARCQFIANCIEKAGPHSGPWRTNAIPGVSWHQHGQAVDLVVVRADQAFDWSDNASYARFGKIAEQCGACWGGHFGDPDHIQAFKDEPLDHYGSIQDVNCILESKWAHLLSGDA